MIGISMRMARIAWPGGDSELRDCLAHDWQPFLAQALPGQAVLPLPNVGGRIEWILGEARFTGFILSGGDNWGAFPMRDETEAAIFAWAQNRNLPVLGVCRGAQVINLLLGGSLSPCAPQAHRRVRHNVNFEANSFFSLPERTQVNSYHDNCIPEKGLAPDLCAWGRCEDGSIEAFSGAGGMRAGILWHPERERTPNPIDLEIFAKFFARRGK